MLVMITPADRPLRILMVMQIPWDRNLGAARVQIELADEFRARGHTVDRYSWFDAFPNRPASKLWAVIGPTFPPRAGRFVRRAGAHYDIIDAQQGSFPFRKQPLGFKGLVVARSIGLSSSYRDFTRYSRRRWPEASGTTPGRLAATWTARRDEPRERSSLEHADLVNVPNRDELRTLRHEPWLGDKSIFIPNGLAHDRFAELDAASWPAIERLAQRRVVFIGWWSTRKGSRDWPEIVRRVREEVPDVRFSFLGTGASPEKVWADVAAGPAEGVEVVPYFETSELPRLLGPATVGALPTYLEGFGLGVLEQLAAGVPTVAYDVPGPRETIPRIDPSLLTPVGDTAAFAGRLTELLRMRKEDYSSLSRRCRDGARYFSWRIIADQTLDAYMESLRRLRRST